MAEIVQRTYGAAACSGRALKVEGGTESRRAAACDFPNNPLGQKNFYGNQISEYRYRLTSKRELAQPAALIQAIALIVALTFSIRASNNVLQTTVPLLSKYDLSYSQFDVGLLIATMSLFALVTTIVNSRVSARRRRYLFILFSAVYAIDLFTFAFSNGISIIVDVSLAGASYGFLFPNIMTSAGLFADQKLRERVIAVYTLALAVSLIAGPALESLVLAHFTLRQSFLFFAPLGAVVAALSPLTKFPEEREKASKSTSVWSKPGFRIGIYTFLVYSMPTAALLTFGGIFARDEFNAPYWVITLIFAAFFTTSFITRSLLSARPIGKLLPYVIFLMSVSLGGLVLVFLSNNLLVYAAAFSALGIPHGLGMPLAMFSISRSFPEAERNKANSYFTSTMMLMQIATPIIGGVALRYVGFRAFIVFTTPLVFALLVLTLWERGKIQATGKVSSLGTQRV